MQYAIKGMGIEACAEFVNIHDIALDEGDGIEKAEIEGVLIVRPRCSESSTKE